MLKDKAHAYYGTAQFVNPSCPVFRNSFFNSYTDFFLAGTLVFLPVTGLTNSLYPFDLDVWIVEVWALFNVLMSSPDCYSTGVHALCSSVLRPCVQYENRKEFCFFKCGEV